MEQVDSHIECVRKTLMVGGVFPCQVVGRTMVWRGAHDGQSGCVVDPAHIQYFEGDKTLIVVHSEHGIEVAKLTATEETVGRVGTKSKDPLLVGFLYGRANDCLLLGTNQSVLAGMRVER